MSNEKNRNNLKKIAYAGVLAALVYKMLYEGSETKKEEAAPSVPAQKAPVNKPKNNSKKRR